MCNVKFLILISLTKYFLYIIFSSKNLPLPHSKTVTQLLGLSKGKHNSTPNPAFQKTNTRNKDIGFQTTYAMFDLPFNTDSEVHVGSQWC